MTAYEQFVTNPHITQGQLARLWELEVNDSISDLLDFCIDFLDQKGFHKTGYTEIAGNYRAVFNSRFYFDGAIQDENRVAIRLIKL
jgi:hypothetical protein